AISVFIVFPPLVYFFHFERDLFIELDFLKLLFLTIGPSTLAMAAGILLVFFTQMVYGAVTAGEYIYDKSHWYYSCLVALILTMITHGYISLEIMDSELKNIEELVYFYFKTFLSICGPLNLFVLI